MPDSLYKFPTAGIRAGYGYFTDVEWHQDVVIVNAETFFRKWLAEEKRRNKCWTVNQLTQKYNKNSQLMSGDDNPIAPFNTTPEYAINRLNQSYERRRLPFEITLVAFNNSRWARKQSRTIDFLNGRHRLINHFKAGAIAIPVQLTLNDGVDQFKKLFEFNGDHKIEISKWDCNEFGVYPKLDI